MPSVLAWRNLTMNHEVMVARLVRDVAGAICRFQSIDAMF